MVSPNKKGSMELSVGTLVTLILGAVIIVGGLVLVYRLVDEGSSVVDRLDGQHRERINHLLTTGQLVAVAPSTQTVDAGKDVTFGLGILNHLDADTKFNILVEGFDGENPLDTTGWVISYFPDIDVGQNEDETAVVGVRSPEEQEPGEYTFIITVTDEGAQLYDSKRFFTVNVE